MKTDIDVSTKMDEFYAAAKARRLWVVEQHKAGKRIVDIAQEIGLSRQRVWQLLHYDKYMKSRHLAQMRTAKE